MMRSWKVLLFVCLFGTGCAVGPRYQRPMVQTPAALKELAGNDQWKMANPSDSLIKGNWWEIFGDPELNRLEELVDANNQNIKQAEAQFREVRTTVLSAQANYYPVIGSSPAIIQTRNFNSRGTNETFSLPAATSWEPDLWGRVRLSIENAVANAQVSAADVENLRLSQQALLASEYFLLAAQDMQLEILRDTIDSYAKNLQLTTDRHAAGIASRSDITLAETQLANAQAQFTDMHVARALAEHSIAMLTGQTPDSLDIASTKINGPPPPIPIGIPSQILERRPDIAASERQLAAASASVGLAKAAFYPTLTLSATPGFLSSGLATLFDLASRSWSASPGLSETVFDSGRRKAALQGAQAAYDGTLAEYRQTILSAFQEVEDDLATLRYLAEEAVQQQQAAEAAQEALDLEIQRYRAGTDSYLNVITTQIIALGARQTTITILQHRMTAAVDLVKALGGGWDASTLPSPQVLRSATLANPIGTQNITQRTGK
jgi:NodT family efflux transporter outer membrane factor (OMF) lipoprotein